MWLRLAWWATRTKLALHHMFYVLRSILFSALCVRYKQRSFLFKPTTRAVFETRSSALAERLRDALCLSVGGFNSKISWTQSSIISYFGFRFTDAYSQFLFCCLWSTCRLIKTTFRLAVINKIHWRVARRRPSAVINKRRSITLLHIRWSSSHRCWSKIIVKNYTSFGI